MICDFTYEQMSTLVVYSVVSLAILALIFFLGVTMFCDFVKEHKKRFEAEGALRALRAEMQRADRERMTK